MRVLPEKRPWSQQDTSPGHQKHLNSKWQDSLLQDGTGLSDKLSSTHGPEFTIIKFIMHF